MFAVAVVSLLRSGRALTAEVIDIAEILDELIIADTLCRPTESTKEGRAHWPYLTSPAPVIFRASHTFILTRAWLNDGRPDDCQPGSFTPG